GLERHARCQVRYRNGLGYLDLARDEFGGLLELVLFGTGQLLAATTPRQIGFVLVQDEIVGGTHALELLGRYILLLLLDHRFAFFRFVSADLAILLVDGALAQLGLGIGRLGLGAGSRGRGGLLGGCLRFLFRTQAGFFLAL